MSGRLVANDRVKAGEIVDASLMELTENFTSKGNAKRLSSEHTERVRMEKENGVESSLPKKEEPGKETPGRSEAFSKYLADLPKKEEEKMKEREQRLFSTGRRKGKLRISAERESDTHDYPAEDAMKLRREVLGMSLFPNLYNRSNLLKAM